MSEPPDISSPGKIKQPKVSLLNDDMDVSNEDKERMLAEQIVSIPLILKNILCRLPKRELLTTALVNKNWNGLSREVLRAVKSSLATLNVIMCGDLNYLDSFLVRTRNIPFNGLRLTVTDCECSVSTVYTSLAIFAKCLLSKIRINYLTVEFEELKTKPCVSIFFIQEVLTKRVEALEGLSLKRVPENTTSLTQIIGLNLEGQFLPNVKYLKFPTSDLLNSMSKSMPASFVKELVEASPRLEKIRGTILTTCLEFLLPMKLHHIVQDFNFQPLQDPLDLVWKFAMEAPQLKQLRFSTRIKDENSRMFHDWPVPEVQKVAHILRMLLIASENSLECLCVDNLDLLLMTRVWDIPILENLHKLHIQEVTGYLHNDEGFVTLSKVDWPRFFPNLTEVLVTQTCSMENYERDFYFGGEDQEVEEDQIQYKCETVRKFVVPQNSYTQLAPLINFAALKIIFPNANTLFVNHGIRSFRLFSNLSVGWPDLETYVCKFEKLDSFFNYDDYFCGISKEESKYLLRNIQQLDTLEIVPKHSCLLHFPKMKKLEIHLKHNRASCNEAAPRRITMFISRLTGRCILQRMPNLTVEIHRTLCTSDMGCHLTLNHLKDFARLVERHDD